MPGSRSRRSELIANITMPHRTPTEADLKRLGAFAEDLWVRCHHAGYDARPTVWTPGLKRSAVLTGRWVRERIEAGHLLDQAEDLVHPAWGCCCGLRFLAQAEPFLDPVDVQRLQELSESPEARKELARLVAACENEQ